ncbi:MAG: YcgL domain-containing protein [Gammaproteobacteria bacterium]|nr:YcgL domain-containing protein [Gammaproteobacteria bacterium]
MTSADKVLCKVYRSPRRGELYLYVTREQDLAPVPDDLLQRFGTPELALTLALTPDRTLARANTDEVLAALRERGWFLQLPPLPDAGIAAIAGRNEKLPRGG